MQREWGWARAWAAAPQGLRGARQAQEEGPKTILGARNVAFS